MKTEELNGHKFIRFWLVRDEEDDHVFWMNDYHNKTFFENWSKGLNCLYYSILKTFCIDIAGREIILDGREAPLLYDHMENQYGELVPTKAIFSKDGKFYMNELNCYNAKDLGLGVCICRSHDTWSEDFEIDADKVSEIVGFLKKELR